MGEEKHGRRNPKLPAMMGQKKCQSIGTLVNRKKEPASQLARGAFKEWHLNHRRLISDQDQVSFDCLERKYEEKLHPLSWVEWSLHKYHALPNLMPHATDPIPDTIQMFQSLVKSWYRVVEDYSNGDLTSKSDKLMALFGIAEIVWDSMKDKCEAGTWRRTIPHGLLWLVGA